MTGPEHYLEAERILRAAAVADPESALVMAQRAQVHATLALAAATALIDETPRSDSHSEYRAWAGVAGSPCPIHTSWCHTNEGGTCTCDAEAAA